MMRSKRLGGCATCGRNMVNCSCRSKEKTGKLIKQLTEVYLGGLKITMNPRPEQWPKVAIFSDAEPPIAILRHLPDSPIYLVLPGVAPYRVIAEIKNLWQFCKAFNLDYPTELESDEQRRDCETAPGVGNHAPGTKA